MQFHRGGFDTLVGVAQMRGGKDLRLVSRLSIKLNHDRALTVPSVEVSRKLLSMSASRA